MVTLSHRNVFEETPKGRVLKDLEPLEEGEVRPNLGRHEVRAAGDLRLDPGTGRVHRGISVPNPLGPIAASVVASGGQSKAPAPRKWRSRNKLLRDSTATEPVAERVRNLPVEGADPSAGSASEGRQADADAPRSLEAVREIVCVGGLMRVPKWTRSIRA